MTDLTFAIEAAKRGCPYVTFVGGLLKFFPRGMQGDCWLIADTYPAARFIIGATLAMWFEENAPAWSLGEYDGAEVWRFKDPLLQREYFDCGHEFSAHRAAKEEHRFWLNWYEQARAFAKGG